MALPAMAVIVVVERLIIGAGGLTVISMVAESVPLTLLAVTVYVATVTAVGVQWKHTHTQLLPAM